MKKINLNLFFHMGVLSFFLLLLWDSRRYSFESRLYPQVIGIIALILIAVSLFQHFRGEEQEKVLDSLASLRRTRFLQISLILVFATAIGFLGGFLLSVLCYYVAYAFFQEDKTKLLRTLSIGIALTVIFYISFGWFLNVPLLRGVLVNF
jgi:putative exporter of polyketide antibiotics